MERKTYTVYKITLPSGNVYVGYTSMPIRERWRHHVKRAANNQAMSEMSESERRAVTEKARASIDRKKQGAAASAGIKRFWEELRKDPDRYQEYIGRRTGTLKRKLKERCNENV